MAVQGIQVLSKIAFNNSSDTTCQNALRCLANAMLLRPPTRQIFVDLEYESKACDRLKNDSRDDEFLVSRILFLTTYGTSVNLEGLIDQRHLAVTINQNLRRHEESIDTKKSSNQMEEMALIETLKLLFNITHFCPQRSHTFTPAVKSIVALTHGRPIQASDPLSASMGPLINSLINIEISGNEEVIQALFPDQDPTTFTSKLIELLDVSTTSYTDAEIEQQTLPLLTLLRKIHESAPENIKVFMMEKILPNDEDRKQVLGQTASLPSRLLKLSTSPLAPQSREAISNLLFEMSDKNASTFVHNVGYGFASGFLFQHNISIPDDALNSTSTNSTPQIPVNPVTGQRMDREAASEGPEMTQEEKEREAEKLMVLFERYVLVIFDKTFYR